MRFWSLRGFVREGFYFGFRVWTKFIAILRFSAVFCAVLRFLIGPSAPPPLWFVYVILQARVISAEILTWHTYITLMSLGHVSTIILIKWVCHSKHREICFNRAFVIIYEVCMNIERFTIEANEPGTSQKLVENSDPKNSDQVLVSKIRTPPKNMTNSCLPQVASRRLVYRSSR